MSETAERDLSTSDPSDPSDDHHHEIPPKQKYKALFASFLVFVMLAAAAGLTALVYLAYLSLQQSEVNGEILEEVHDSNDRLIDCTTPTGECFKNSQARTGEAVLGINAATLNVIVAALSCQEDGLTDEKELARCTTRRASTPATGE